MVGFFSFCFLLGALEGTGLVVDKRKTANMLEFMSYTSFFAPLCVCFLAASSFLFSTASTNSRLWYCGKVVLCSRVQESDSIQLMQECDAHFEKSLLYNYSCGLFHCFGLRTEHLQQNHALLSVEHIHDVCYMD